MADIVPNWYLDWITSIPLLLITVAMHVFGLIFVRNEVIDLLERLSGRRRFAFVFALVMGVTVLLITVLHGLEAAVYGAAYLLVGALPDVRTAMLYSLSAMTTYGHASIYLEPHWQMLGAIEALNGVVLFGLTTAALYSVMESMSKLTGKRRNR
jgi:hypothetical protein